jgi:hypothetical protein
MSAAVPRCVAFVERLGQGGLGRCGQQAEPKKVFKQPGAFALAVITQFRANQGVLLAGAVAYYTLLFVGAAAHSHSNGALPYRSGRPPSFDPKGISRVCSSGTISCVSRGSSDLPRSKASRRRHPIRHHAFLQRFGIYHSRERNVGNLLSSG